MFNSDDFIIVLTGAGISAESGIKTFRDSDGLWENHRIEDVATPEAFSRNPVLVWNFYKQRYFQSLEVEPNAGHHALVELEKHLGDRYLLVTQNVDGLHSRAGSERVLEMHGRLSTCFCVKCRKNYDMKEVDLTPDIPKCLACNQSLRPDIVWFGEMPYFLDEIYEALSKATVFVTIGTSGNVYPASYFITVAQQSGAKTIGVNLDKPENNQYIDMFYQGKAGEMLPALIKEWIK